MNIIDEKNYVDVAEGVIPRLKARKDKYGKPIGLVTTSKIRNLLSMSSDIYNEVSVSQSDVLSDRILSRIQYLRIRFLYESGRDEKVKAFVEEARLLEILKSIGTEKKNFLLFNHYMEALIAYHRFNGGKD